MRISYWSSDVCSSDLRFGIRRQFDRFRSRVAAGTGNYWNTASHVLNRHLDQFAMLLHRNGRRLAGSADYHNTVGTFSNMPLQQIGRPTSGERMSWPVTISVVAVSLKKKTRNYT